MFELTSTSCDNKVSKVDRGVPSDSENSSGVEIVPGENDSTEPAVEIGKGVAGIIRKIFRQFNARVAPATVNDLKQEKAAEERARAAEERARIAEMCAKELASKLEAAEIRNRRLERTVRRLQGEIIMGIPSTEDGLTGLVDQKTFEDHGQEFLEKLSVLSNYVSCLAFDLDHFGKVNKSYGHPAGDFVLKEFAKLLQSSKRPADIFFRVGGEEFFGLLGTKNVDDAWIVAERIRENIEGKYFFRRTEGEKSVYGIADAKTLVPKDCDFCFQVTVSVGVKNYSSQNPNITELREKADEALRMAKGFIDNGEIKAGRNRVWVHGTGNISPIKTPTSHS